jgi:hypothetical protein
MIAISKPIRQAANVQHNERFLELVPAIERFARLAFRHVQPEEGEEAICEAVAYAYCAFRRLSELGKLDVAYASPLARFGVARLRAGRRIGSKQNARDVFSVAAQRRLGFSLVSLHATCSDSEIWEEALADDTLTPIPDQVAFRLDFPAWLQALNRRDRKLVKFLALGNTPSEAAQQFRVSKARISQLRKELHSRWQAFHCGAARPAPISEASQRR